MIKLVYGLLKLTDRGINASIVVCSSQTDRLMQDAKTRVGYHKQKDLCKNHKTGVRYSQLKKLVVRELKLMHYVAKFKWLVSKKAWEETRVRTSQDERPSENVKTGVKKRRLICCLTNLNGLSSNRQTTVLSYQNERLG